MLGCQDAGMSVAPSGMIDPVAASAAEAWIHQPPPESRLQSQPRVPHYAVSEAKQSEALGALSARPYVVLPTEDADRFVGTGVIPKGTSDIPVLLRCVQPAFGPMDAARDDTLQVSWREGTVEVVYLALRNQYMPLRRIAVLALLPSEPQEVYVDALTAIR
jgi:hypothetical protein